MPHTLSLPQARKLILFSQGLSTTSSGCRLSTDAVLQRLGYVQIDTISVVQRAHHHTFWSRKPNYRVGGVERLVAEGKAFEYWSHAAAYLPMNDFRFSLPRKAAIASGVMDHWYPRDENQMREVLARIRAEGPLKARDFEQDNRLKRPGEWHQKPAKRALTNLFMQGDLMCARRDGFQMVYELRERVLPAHVDTRCPDPDKYTRHLIIRYLQANGLGQAKQIGYLRKGLKKQLKESLNAQLEAREIIEISVAGQNYFALPKQLDLLNKRMAASRACILSPFDNLLIQRHRMRELFNYDYQIECYTPAAKRMHGYFCLPVLWRGKLVARIDCKADRKTRTLRLLYIHTEKTLKDLESFAQALRRALDEFASFNSCEQLDFSVMKKTSLSSALQVETV